MAFSVDIVIFSWCIKVYRCISYPRVYIMYFSRLRLEKYIIWPLGLPRTSVGYLITPRLRLGDFRYPTSVIVHSSDSHTKATLYIEILLYSEHNVLFETLVFYYIQNTMHFLKH